MKHFVAALLAALLLACSVGAHASPLDLRPVATATTAAAFAPAKPPVPTVEAPTVIALVMATLIGAVFLGAVTHRE